MADGPGRAPTRILLTRHGQTVANREGRFCGQSETPLTDFGLRQAEALGNRLRDTEIHAAYTSDLSRAIDTAARVVAGRDVGLQLDPGLREIHYGEWEMAREREIAKSAPELFKLMRREHPDWRPPGGESPAEVRARTSAAIRRIAAKHRHETVLVVSHGDAILCLVAEVLGMPLEKTYRLEIANCSVSELVARGGQLAVVSLNDRSHLAALEP